MAKIEDYGLIGDSHTAALVSREGSIDWLCLPRFDSPACFAALLGTPENGHWRIAPVGQIGSSRRRYRESTMILETDVQTATGRARLIDFMTPRDRDVDVVRIVEGLEGTASFRTELVIRFDYGKVVPWVRRSGQDLQAVAGPDALRLRTSVPLHGEGLRTVGDFVVAAGQRVAFDLAWFPSHLHPPEPIDAEAALKDTEREWRSWVDRCSHEGPWRDAVVRSLITLKALTYAPTGGIVAAPTTSLPESLGGVRNWDYRYCWLRDATFTLYALLQSGYRSEAEAWREWLLRAVAGSPSQLQIMYGIAGERRLQELELPWLPGYEDSRPVHVGNAAHSQFQLDVYGEIMDAMHESRRAGIDPGPNAWRLQLALVRHLETAWALPDEGIWEVRGPRRNFTHSKIMAWVAFDRAVKAMEQGGLEGPLDRWRALRQSVHDQVCREGFDASLNSFVQSYGSRHLDASLLMIPLVGFLPASDPRVRGTVDAIGRELLKDGFVARYRTDPEVDGLPVGEGAFLLCTFWYADNLALLGRRDEAIDVFHRLLEIRNDLGLLAEGYDVARRRQVGNFPQAFSHIGLINTARNLTRPGGPAEDRPKA